VSARRKEINLKKLRNFCKVVEVGNMTKAAEQLHIALPALGQQMRQLEESLGVPLLVRHSRGVAPTEAGSLVF
jgi:LysR family nitrogen assimilation transcriptional regulator